MSAAAGRVVEVDVDRLSGWVERFAGRHGPLRTHLLAGGDEGQGEQGPGDGRRAVVVIEAGDGARAEIAIPYGPWSEPAAEDPVEALLDHVRAARTVGVLLVRRGGWAVAVVADGQVVATDTGGGYVQGTTKAGGWSQQRYARRRGNQTHQVWDRAADGAAAILLPYASALGALVTGGDRAGVAAVLGDPRLADLRPLVASRFFAVGDPKRAVLDDVVRRLASVVVTLNELA